MFAVWDGIRDRLESYKELYVLILFLIYSLLSIIDFYKEGEIIWLSHLSRKKYVSKKGFINALFHRATSAAFGTNVTGSVMLIRMACGVIN